MTTEETAFCQQECKWKEFLMALREEVYNRKAVWMSIYDPSGVCEEESKQVV